MIEILGKVGFDWQVALANFVNFVIIFFILKKFAFRPILKIVNERQNKIDEGLLNAEKAESNLLMAEENRKQIVSKAKLEANNIIGDAQTKGESIIEKSKEDALSVRVNIIKEGEIEIEEKRKSLQKELQKENSSLIIESLEKILHKKFTKEENEYYIKNILSN